MKCKVHIAMTFILATTALAGPDTFYLKSDDNTYGPFVLTNGATINIGTRILHVVSAKSPTATPNDTSAPTANVISVSAKELCDAYKVNEIAGDAKYLALTDKTIRITGVVDKVEKVRTDHKGQIVTAYMVRLEGNGEISNANVKCMMYDSAGLEMLVAGLSITIEGTYKGVNDAMFCSPFLIDDCVIVKK